MKTELTPEQSGHLIKLGVPREKASGVKKEGHWDYGEYDYHYWTVFTLIDLLNILPNELLGDYNRIIESTNEYHLVYYHNGVDEEYLVSVHETELIDALYKIIELLLKNKFLIWNT